MQSYLNKHPNFSRFFHINGQFLCDLSTFCFDWIGRSPGYTEGMQKMLENKKKCMQAHEKTEQLEFYKINVKSTSLIFNIEKSLVPTLNIYLFIFILLFI